MGETGHTRVQAPPGVQCFVGDEARRRRRVEERVLAVFEGWSYEEIIPPLFDFADVFPDELQSRTYALVGRDGSLLALRPDFTSLLAKLAAGRLADRPAPLRLYYSGEVVRYEPPQAGRQSELFQMGCELMGARGLAADAEVLAVAVECLEAAGARDFILSLGHVGVFSALVAESGFEGARLAALRERIEAKDEVGVRSMAQGCSPPLVAALARLAAFSGNTLAPDLEGVLAFSPAARSAFEELRAVVAALESAGLGAHVTVDLGEVRGLAYYTGLVFRAYASGLGFDVATGGRYDTLLGRFGRPLPAIGFMLGLDRLALLLERQSAPVPDAAPLATGVSGTSVAARLRHARELRGQGLCVRFDGAEATP